MTTPFSDDLISAYLDGELTAEEHSHVERQLRENADLRKMCDELRALRTTLQAIPVADPPKDLAQRVLRQAERRMLLGTDSPADEVANDACPADRHRDVIQDDTDQRVEPGSTVTHSHAPRWRIIVACIASAAALLIATSLLWDPVQWLAKPQSVASAPDQAAESSEPDLAETPALSDFESSDVAADSIADDSGMPDAAYSFRAKESTAAKRQRSTAAGVAGSDMMAGDGTGPGAAAPVRPTMKKDGDSDRPMAYGMGMSDEEDSSVELRYGGAAKEKETPPGGSRAQPSRQPGGQGGGGAPAGARGGYGGRGEFGDADDGSYGAGSGSGSLAESGSESSEGMRERAVRESKTVTNAPVARDPHPKTSPALDAGYERSQIARDNLVRQLQRERSLLVQVSVPRAALRRASGFGESLESGQTAWKMLNTDSLSALSLGVRSKTDEKLAKAEGSLNIKELYVVEGTEADVRESLAQLATRPGFRVRGIQSSALADAHAIVDSSLRGAMAPFALTPPVEADEAGRARGGEPLGDTKSFDEAETARDSSALERGRTAAKNAAEADDKTTGQAKRRVVKQETAAKPLQKGVAEPGAAPPKSEGASEEADVTKSRPEKKPETGNDEPDRLKTERKKEIARPDGNEGGEKANADSEEEEEGEQTGSADLADMPQSGVQPQTDASEDRVVIHILFRFTSPAPPTTADEAPKQ